MLRNFVLLFIICTVTALITLQLAHNDRTNKPVSDFSFKNISGESGSLSGIKGPVVLHFWATWCAPCIEELPALLATANKTPGTTYLLISADRDKDVVTRFLDNMVIKKQKNTVIIHDPAMIITQGIFKVTRFPESLILSADKIVERHIFGPAKWE